MMGALVNRVDSMAVGALAMIEGAIGMNLVDIPGMFRRAPAIDERIKAIPFHDLIHELVPLEVARVKKIIEDNKEKFHFCTDKVADLTPYVVVKLGDQGNRYDVFGAFQSDNRTEQRVPFTGPDLKYIADAKQTGNYFVCEMLPDKGMAEVVVKDFDLKVDEMRLFYMNEAEFLADDPSPESE